MEWDFFLLSKSCDADCVSCIIVTDHIKQNKALIRLICFHLDRRKHLYVQTHVCEEKLQEKHTSVAAGARDERRNINAHNIQLRATVHLHHYSKRVKRGWNVWKSVSAIMGGVLTRHSLVHTLTFSLTLTRSLMRDLTL